MKNALYVVVRADLSPGVQMAQLSHAAYEYGRAYPEEWCDTHVVLNALDEHSLQVLLMRAGKRKMRMKAFYEPDRGNELTAVAFGPAAGRILRHLPLAGPFTLPAV